MNIKKITQRLAQVALTAAAFLPSFAHAQDTVVLSGGVASGIGAFTTVFVLLAFLVLSGILTRVWVGIVNVSLLDVEPLSSIEKRHPYLPSFKTILLTVFGSLLLVAISIKTVGAIAPFQGEGGVMRACEVLGGLGLLLGLLLIFWKDAKEYVFAVLIGTFASFILISFSQTILSGATQQDPFFITLSLLALVLVWRFLFGPWDARVKATVLGTFIAWVGYNMLFQEVGIERTAHVVSILLAAIPAVIWCILFLPYHRERMSSVLLMFFSGMVATVPVLFYNALVNSSAELQFFVFRIVPENFNTTVQSFITTVSSAPSFQTTLLSYFLTFLFVGLLEEGSKYWVLRRNGERFFTSIDDAMQLAIMVAIGFAFAENIMNSGYFPSFVKEFLLNGGNVDWGGFLGNFAGRAILTSMVHIVSTGIVGYFLGLALFADQYVAEAKKEGRRFYVAEAIHWMFGLREKPAFRTEMFSLGLGLAVFLHALSNFLVTLPDVLPGNPRTLGDLFHSPAGSPFHYIALLLLPSLLYVVGGFWLLTTLFLQDKNMKERGQAVTDVFVTAG